MRFALWSICLGQRPSGHERCRWLGGGWDSGMEGMAQGKLSCRGAGPSGCMVGASSGREHQSQVIRQTGAPYRHARWGSLSIMRRECLRKLAQRVRSLEERSEIRWLPSNWQHKVVAKAGMSVLRAEAGVGTCCARPRAEIHVQAGRQVSTHAVAEGQKACPADRRKILWVT